MKRLWQKKPSLSVVMIPNVVREKEGAPASQKLLTQSGQPLLTESGMEILLN